MDLNDVETVAAVMAAVLAATAPAIRSLQKTGRVERSLGLDDQAEHRTIRQMLASIMHNQDRLSDLLADHGERTRKMSETVSDIGFEVKHTSERVDRLETRVTRLEDSGQGT